MVLGSKLLHRFFLAMVSIIVIFALAIYLYSVPLIKSTVYGIERNASRTVLNNVYQLAEKIHFSLEGYRLQALESRKQQLQSVVTLATAYVETVFAQAERGELSEAAARQQIFAAGLDVTTPEPLPPTHPLVGLPNVLILPHIGSATETSRHAMAEIAVDNVLAGLRNETLRCEVTLA